MNVGVLLRGGLVTLEIAGGAWLVSLLLGLLLASLDRLGVPGIAVVVQAVVTVLRSVPELVLLYLLYFGVTYIGVRFGSLQAAIVGLGVIDAAFTSEYFRAALSTVPPSQAVAARSLGLREGKIFRHVLLPQAVPTVIPPILNSFIGLTKTASLASAIGAPEILFKAESQMSLSGNILGIDLFVVAVYIVATLPLTYAVSRLEIWSRARSARA